MRSRARPSSGASSVSSTPPTGTRAARACCGSARRRWPPSTAPTRNIPGLAHEDQLAQWRERLDAMGDTTATFEWAFRWLGRPPAAAVDARFWCTATTGWETSSSTDPTWPPSSTGSWYTSARRTRTWPGSASGPGGSALRPAWAPGASAASRASCGPTRQASATTVDRVAFHWWLVLATLRWGVICRYQAERHLSGQFRSVELATIGRRVCETEWDLLDLLDGGPAARSSRTGAVRDRARRRWRPSWWPRSPNSSKPMSGRRPADRSTSTPGWPPTRCASSSANCSTRARRKSGAALAGLGFADEEELAAAIRAGELDGRADDVTACLRTLVRHRLAVAHPGYDSE